MGQTTRVTAKVVKHFSHRRIGEPPTVEERIVCGELHPDLLSVEIGICCGREPSHSAGHRYFALGLMDAEEVPPKLSPRQVERYVEIIRNHGNALVSGTHPVEIEPKEEQDASRS